MEIAVGSDEKTRTTDFVVEYCKQKGHKVRFFGALIKPKALWSEVAWEVAEAVKSGSVNEGILMCWTGTGVALAASKVSGIRAVTVTNVKTTAGARKWNHANILCFSCFLDKKIVKKILDTWFSTAYSQEPKDVEGVRKLEEIENKYLKKIAPSAPRIFNRSGFVYGVTCLGNFEAPRPLSINAFWSYYCCFARY